MCHVRVGDGSVFPQALVHALSRLIARVSLARRLVPFKPAQGLDCQQTEQEYQNPEIEGRSVHGRRQLDFKG